MNSEKLSPRLNQVAKYIIEEGSYPIRLADIGSDHAYLPCYLALNGALDFAIAGEVVEGPYRSALAEVTRLGINQIISVRKGDGLEVIEAEDGINTLSICGMGGGLIRDILKRGQDKIAVSTTLVLQPNVGGHLLRQFLLEEGFTIIKEEVVLDGGRYYEMMVAQFTPSIETSPWSNQEIFLGRYNLETMSPAFQSKWQSDYAQLDKVYQGLLETKGPQHKKTIEIKEKLDYIKEAGILDPQI